MDLRDPPRSEARLVYASPVVQCGWSHLKKRSGKCLRSRHDVKARTSAARRLLPQPQGFEGFGSVGKRPHSDNAFVADRHRVERRNFDIETAVSTTASLEARKENVLSVPENLGWLKGIGLPGPQPSGEVFDHLVPTSNYAHWRGIEKIGRAHV